MFTTETLVALAVGGVLGLAIPIAAIIIYKKKNRDTWLPSAFIGAGTFILFAMILETLLHRVMLPIVQGNVWTYAIYGALAAGVFEETGRFVAYKTLMKKHYSTKNAVLMGLGHGGIEVVIVLGVSYLAYLVLALAANSYGSIEALVEAMKGSAASNGVDVVLITVEKTRFKDIFSPLCVRLIAMTFHVCMSVWVYKAVSQKGKIWLYPVAIAAHALLDFFAALYQTGVISSVLLLYIILTVFAAVIVFATVMLAKKLPDKENT